MIPPYRLGKAHVLSGKNLLILKRWIASILHVFLQHILLAVYFSPKQSQSSDIWHRLHLLQRFGEEYKSNYIIMFIEDSGKLRVKKL